MLAEVGRDFPLSMEKLSPILAFYVEDGIERGAARCNEVLHYGGMGHTAGIHTRSREAAVRYGGEMPASRITVNTPTTHGAIGFSTALPPSMTLGCGSWGGNVTSDNVSPLHLMDIKRVAFETRPSQVSARRLPPTGKRDARHRHRRVRASCDCINISTGERAQSQSRRDCGDRRSVPRESPARIERGAIAIATACASYAATGSTIQASMPARASSNGRKGCGFCQRR
jgi:hypothetical protein